MPPITRKQWGAKYADGFRDRPMPITEWWLHHSVTIAPDLLPPFTDDDEAVRTLERIGQQRFSGGISYTYPVTPVGRLYQGHSLHRQGAHTFGHNTAGGAFVLVGDHRKKAPTPEQREAIARRMVEDHRAGHATRHTLNGGHRQASRNVGTTECPGDAAVAAIPAINARANELWAAGYPGTPVPEEDDMPITDKVVPSDMLANEDAVSIPRALDLIMRWSLEARDNAIQARKIAEAQALKGGALTGDEVKAAVREALTEAAQIEVVVRPQEA